MSNRIVNTAKRATQIVNTSARANSLEGVTVAKDLGGRPTGYKLDKDTSPITLFQIREELNRLLISAGGRPSLAGAQDKVKVPRFADDWAKIEELTKSLADTAVQGMSFRPSPAQVAAVLLHEALERFSDEEVRRVVRQRTAA